MAPFKKRNRGLPPQLLSRGAQGVRKHRRPASQQTSAAGAQPRGGVPGNRAKTKAAVQRELAEEIKRADLAEKRAIHAELMWFNSREKYVELKADVARRYIELWEYGLSRPKCEERKLQLLNDTIGRAVERLGLDLTAPATQAVLRGFIEATARDATDHVHTETTELDDLDVMKRVFEMRAVMDNHAISEATVERIFMTLKLGTIGMSKQMLLDTRKSLDDVLHDKFGVATLHDITFADPLLVMKQALLLADARGGTNPKFVLVGDGRTASKKTTTFVALRLVGHDKSRRQGYKQAIMPLAILNTGEKYHKLSALLKTLSATMERLQLSGFMGPFGEWVTPVFYLGGDMKWLNMVCGLPPSKNACVHCKCKTSERPMIEKWWKIDRDPSDPQEENRQFPAIFPFIPASHIMPDFLHLHLRVGERLIHLFAAKVLAAANRPVSCKDAERTSQAEYLAQQFGPQIADLTGLDPERVGFVWKTSSWEITPKPDGNRLRRLLAGFKVASIPVFAEHAGEAGWDNVSERMQAALDTFVLLYNVINRPYPFRDPEETTVDGQALPITAAEFALDVQAWVATCCAELVDKDICKQYSLFPAAKFVTPYVHTFMQHVPLLIEEHEDLHEFGGQEFEKVNNDHTQLYYNCSHRRKDEGTRPIFLTALRAASSHFAADEVWVCPSGLCGHRFQSRATLANHLRKQHQVTLTAALELTTVGTAVVNETAKQSRLGSMGDELRASALLHLVRRRELARNEQCERRRLARVGAVRKRVARALGRGCRARWPQAVGYLAPASHWRIPQALPASWRAPIQPRQNPCFAPYFA